MSDREQRLEDALNEILHWANAYPKTVFIEPDFEKVERALKAVGISMSALHGSWARHLLEGVGGIATEALHK